MEKSPLGRGVPLRTATFAALLAIGLTGCEQLGSALLAPADALEPVALPITDAELSGSAAVVW